MTDQRRGLAGPSPLDLSTIQSTSSLSIEQRVERATRILDEAVSPTFTPQGSPHTPTQLSPLRQAVGRALKVADEAAAPQAEPEPTTTEEPDELEEPVIRNITSSLLDPLDPHWTETRQQQMLHEARIPPRPPTPTETSPVDDIKKRLERIADIHDNLKKSYDQTRSKIRTIAAPTPPEGPPKAIPSVSSKLAWSLPAQNKFGTTTPNPKPSQIPFGGPPPPAPPPGPLPQLPPNPHPTPGEDESLQGNEPFVFDGNRRKTDQFLHELRLYQFVNATHPIMMNPWQKVAHALTYVNGPNVYEWKRSAENWILSIPAPSAPNRTIYEEFEEEFIESWTDTNEPYRAAADLDKLRMRRDNVDEYITRFAELARKALYREDDPAVLEKFKAGLPLELLEPCVHHDNPQDWEAWTRSARARQAILTSLKTHRTETTPRAPSPMKVCTPTPPSTPPPSPMEIDKMYTIPARRQPPTPKDDERRKGLCHLCKKRGHIQRHCPKKIPEQPARMANTQTVPSVADQGMKRPRSPTMDGIDVLRYLKRTTPENRNEVVAELMKPATRQDFSLA